MKGPYHIIIFIFLLSGMRLDAQVRQTDSLDAPVAVGRTDSLPPGSVPRVKLSKDSLEAEVDYGAQDSMIFNQAKNEVHLIGDAYVQYQTLSLKAGYIILNLDSNLATATGLLDSAGVLEQIPEFEEGDQSFKSKRMRYNFRTQRGIIYEAVTREGDLFVLGDKTKFVSGGSDSLYQEDVLYNDGALITTCDHDVPHFGIRARKIKTIPDRVAVVGPSNLEIGGVPTPLWLPFGFFPTTKGERSGLIFPSDYEYSDNWGFGLRDVGYYFPISEYIDAKVLFDIYFNGSWGAKVVSNYAKRYKFRGSINLAYSNRETELAGSYLKQKQRSFSLRVSHNQDSKAHPYSRIGGSINIQSNGYQELNENDASSVLTNTFNSNFAWNRTFADKPFSFNLSMSHSQNTRSRQVTVSLPNLDFRLNRIFPFKRKRKIGKEKWYEKIAFQYNGSFKNRLSFQDTVFFTQEMWESATMGAQHRATADLNFSVLKFFNVTPSVNYDETWFFKTIEQSFRFDPNDPAFVRQDTIYNIDSTFFEVVQDTVSFGEVRENEISDFQALRKFRAALSVNTQIFGTLEFKKGWLRGLRHVLKPSFSFSYEPESSSALTRTVQTDIRQGPEDFDAYSILQNGVFSASLVPEKRMAMSYSFNNIFEAKYFSKKDSSEKKFKLFDNIIISGNHNFAADSLKWSQVNMRGATRFLKGLSTLSLSATFDPYEVDERGRRINRFVWDTRKKFLRFGNAQLRLNTRGSIQKIVELFSGKKQDSPQKQESRERPPGQKKSIGGPAPPSDPFFDLFNSFTFGHNLVIRALPDTTIVSTHTFNIRGSIRLTPKWRVEIGNIGYDFKSKQLTYPDLSISRDLHCWDMRFSWQPQRGTYSFYIGVKPGSIDFIKIPYRKNNVDGFGGF